ncbi:unnamed protein product, partial [marine sediment metagenome]
MAVKDVDGVTPSCSVVPDDTEWNSSQNSVHAAAQNLGEVITVKNLSDIPHVVSGIV